MSWRRILLLSLLFVFALLGTTWAVLQRSDAATAIVRRKLAEVLATPATVASTELDLTAGRLIVRGLQVQDPNRPNTALCRAERVDLDVEIDPLGDLVALRRIALTGLEIDIGANPPTLAQLLKTAEKSAGSALVPTIELSDARLRLTLGENTRPIEFGQLELTATPLQNELRTLVIRGKGHVIGLGANLAVKGSVDTATGTTALSATVIDCPLNTDCLRWLEQRLALRFEDVDISGTLTRLEIGFTSATGPDGAVVARVEARGSIKGTRITAPDLPRHLQSADVTFFASSDNNGELSVHVTQVTSQGEIDITSEVTELTGDPSFSVRASGTNLVIDEDVNAALRLFPVGARVVDALQAQSGRADIELYLRDPQRPDGIAEFDMTVRDCVLSYHGYGGEDAIGFPLPLVGAHGRVLLHNDLVELEQIGASIAPSAGGGEVTLSGQINTLAAVGENTTIDIRVENVTFGDHLRAPLADLLGDDGALYDRLAPQGKADVDVAIRPMSVLTGGWSVAVRPQDATVTWAGCPYRLDHIRGDIRVRAERADFDLEGRHGDGTVSLHGRIPLGAAHEEDAGFEVAVQLSDLTVDDELRRAVAVMAPAIDSAWRGCAPTGSCGGTVRAWRPSPDADLHFDLRIGIVGVDLCLPVDPWHARGLSGQLLIAGSGDEAHIDFDALRGHLDDGAGPPAQLAMLGQVKYGAVTESDLSLVVRGLELDPQLGQTLELLGALGPDVWNYLRPSGSVDLVCRHNLLPDGTDDLSLVVHLLDVGSDAPILPEPARKMTGELEIANGKVTFGELRANLGDQLVRCKDGVIETAPPPDGRTLIAFTVTAADFPLGSGLANLFPGPLSETIRERELSGTADIDLLKLSFAVPTKGSSMPFETMLSGKLRLQDVGLTLGTGKEGFRVDRIHGTVELDESSVGDTGGLLLGTLSDGSLRIFDQPFETVSARFATDAERMSLTGLQARFHGGRLKQGDGEAPAFVYSLPAPEIPDGRLEANLAFERVDVHAFLSTAGWPSPPYRGAASGYMILDRLDGHGIVDAVGNGALAIGRGDLGVVPLFTAIYSQLPAPERPRFDQLGLELRLENRQVAFSNLVLRSNLLEATGNGTLDLDGYLDVKLTLDNLLGNTADPVFMPLIDFLTQNIVRFHLFGHLRDLKAEKRWFTESSPRRPPIPPLSPVFKRRPIADY